MYLNLMPPDLSRKMLVRRRLRQWACVWGILVVIGLLVVFDCRMMSSEAHSRFELLASRTRPLQRLAAETAAMQLRSQELMRQAKTLEAIRGNDRALDLLAIVGQSAHSISGQMQIDRMSVASSQAKTTNDNGADKNLSSLVLHGMTDVDTGVADFIESLRASGVFSEVELRSSHRYTINQTPCRQFQVECQFLE